MAACPISYIEIDAYSRLERVELSAFEVRLIRRLDRIAMKASADRTPGASDIPATTNSAPVHDDAAVAAMFKGMAQRRRQAGRR